MFCCYLSKNMNKRWAVGSGEDSDVMFNMQNYSIIMILMSAYRSKRTSHISMSVSC
ncbi:Uncharacterized protein EbC_pEb17201590 (plasmid) [Erwinia billingiae Eb661]|uniref:Uncharacterized protein n=1 Tax=Erwinia billingiae (strain Eb661) TaxID=634500 RepID=D8MK14_ERWBE|nr:Uncharacterized protein EbC_pEb17201590 [Erwinia billingiae Eb661]